MNECLRAGDSENLGYTICHCSLGNGGNFFNINKKKHAENETLKLNMLKLNNKNYTIPAALLGA
jgi:hypothetical protein